MELSTEDRLLWFFSGLLIGTGLDRFTIIAMIGCWVLITNKKIPFKEQHCQELVGRCASEVYRFLVSNGVSKQPIPVVTDDDPTTQATP